MTKCRCGAEVTLHVHHFYEGTGYASRKAGEKSAREWTYQAALYHHPVTRESFCGPACATKALKPLDRCPHGDGNACEKYRLQGQRCQGCPLLKIGEVTEEDLAWARDQAAFIEETKPKLHALLPGESIRDAMHRRALKPS